ncbi:diaminobutyrate acetyltransferase [Oceanobacter mangrovi]|uniref:diaminobutyrate acetyltransferase n=1 Tax=Oceanobacter mangrovi TaxID=2862510 RepID=UPI001C8E25CF|nr:diaminobutyrate acetyltransferase [Oceanobacter mangrovi]
MTDSDTSLVSENLTERKDFVFRKPSSTDGSAVFWLIDQCKPLDVNSMYCNLLQCSHFRDTAILAEQNGQLAGFVSGYRLPERPEVLFVWQLAVAPSARGQGLASQMLLQLLQRLGADVRYLHTSITPSNLASWNTFRKLASSLDTELSTSVMFDQQQHFGGAHDSEELLEIGPFSL